MGKWLKNKTKAAPARIAHCTIQPNQFHIYTLPEGGFQASQRFRENQVHLREKKLPGELSDKARKRIEHAINWLLIKSSPKPIFNWQQEKMMFFRLNFMTVTLPSKQIHSDQVITSVCLNNFLNVLRKEGNLTDYIWRAEAQENGNIHYHITTNQYFHWREVRKWWNQSVNLLGYVDRFEKKFHHRNPNSTDVRKVKHVRKLAAYLSKYMAKGKSFMPVGELRLIGKKIVEVRYDSKVYRDEGAYMKQGKVIGTMLSGRCRKIDARLWSCSQSISKCKPFKIERSSVQWDSIVKLSFSDMFHKVPGDYVDSYYGPVLHAASLLAPGLFYDIKAHAQGKRVNQVHTDEKILQYLE